MENDILSLLSSSEKPFSSTKTMIENSNKKNTVSLWDKKDFKPSKIDVSKLSRSGKTFSFVPHNPKDTIEDDIKEKIITIAKVLFTKGYTFRYNGDKEDLVSIAITELPNAVIDTYLPWKKFNEDAKNVILNYPTEAAYSIGTAYHKIFLDLKPSTRAIVSRDVHVCLGKTCTDPLNILLIYNLDGSEVITKTADFKKMGNTVFYTKIAAESNIPVYNFKNESSITRLIEYIKLTSQQ